MKKIYLLIVLTIAFISIATAQDVIYKKNGDKIKAKIISFGSSTISYKIWEYQKAPSQSISTSEVKYVKYHNGTIKNTSWYANNKKVTKGTFTDKRDGITYKTITFAGQTWMAENLRATKTTQGVDITWVVSNEDWGNLNYSDLAYCYYNNDPDLGKTYGCLYTFEASKNVCPAGWHLPTDDEWTTFTNNIAKYYDLDVIVGEYGRINKVGGLLKETGTLHWKSPNTGATNKISFSALPAGYRFHQGNFRGLGNYGFWWTTESTYRNLNCNNAGVAHGYGSANSFGYSVRCLRD